MGVCSCIGTAILWMIIGVMLWSVAWSLERLEEIQGTQECMGWYRNLFHEVRNLPEVLPKDHCMELKPLHRVMDYCSERFYIPSLISEGYVYHASSRVKFTQGQIPKWTSEVPCEETTRAIWIMKRPIMLRAMSEMGFWNNLMDASNISGLYELVDYWYEYVKTQLFIPTVYIEHQWNLLKKGSMTIVDMLLHR